MKRSYSRRELYALGEPLGDSATYRKAGGLVLGDGGGGGGGAPATPDKTTQTMELPEWARPYAQSTLAKGAALTDINQNPYQQYGGNRIAGFSPMQMRSFQGAANMDAGPRGFQENVGGYMSPYMQNVVDVEKRGAIRDYQVGNTMQQAQATQAGAFGGGREAIQRAERERGLMGTLGGIQARGSQAAFDQAANQFRQGISQGMDVSKLQNTYGGQMQQQAQRPLDMAYQDFQTQQNYPYKQLGFMSDLVRGMPLGQKSTTSVYEAPGSTMGQLAGLGMGAYGLSRMMMAEGGAVHDYAEGGVTSDQNVEGILSKLSDQQLQQAKQGALARRDVEQANMIDAEISMRASARSGIGAGISPEFADQMEEGMASGGIVAFADKGAVKDEEASSPFYDLLGKFGRAINPAASGSQKELESKQAIMDKARELRNEEPDFFSVMKPSEREAKTKDIEQRRKNLSGVAEKVSAGDYSAVEALKNKPKQGLPQKSPEDIAKAEAVNRKIQSEVTSFEPPAPQAATQKSQGLSSGSKPSKAEVKSAVAQFAEQKDLGSDEKEGLMTTALKIREEFGKQNQPILDKLNAAIEGQKPNEQALKDRGISQALAQFGFSMAERASKPKAKFLESASGAAPVLASVAEKTNALIDTQKQNYTNLKLDQAKYEVALAKGDMQTAATLAGQIRQQQQQDQMLKFNIAKAQDELALKREELANTRNYQGQMASRYETVGSLTKEIMQNEGLPYGKALEKAGNILKPAGYAADTRADASTRAALATALGKVEEKYPAITRTGPSKMAQGNRAAYENAVNSVYSTFGAEPQGAPSAAQAGANSGQWGNLRVKP